MTETNASRQDGAAVPYDMQRKKWFKTAEPMVAEPEWDLPGPLIANAAIVEILVGFAEIAVRQRVQQAGERRNQRRAI